MKSKWVISQLISAHLLSKLENKYYNCNVLSIYTIKWAKN